MKVNDVESLIPADALPSIHAALFLLALHWIEETSVVFDEFFEVEAADAQTTLAEGAVRVALDVHELAVLVSIVDDLAAIVAARAAPSGRTRAGEVSLLPLVHIISVEFFVVGKFHTNPPKFFRTNNAEPFKLSLLRRDWLCMTQSALIAAKD